MVCRTVLVLSNHKFGSWQSIRFSNSVYRSDCKGIFVIQFQIANIVHCSCRFALFKSKGIGHFGFTSSIVHKLTWADQASAAATNFSTKYSMGSPPLSRGACQVNLQPLLETLDTRSRSWGIEGLDTTLISMVVEAFPKV